MSDPAPVYLTRIGPIDHRDGTSSATYLALAAEIEEIHVSLESVSTTPELEA